LVPESCEDEVVTLLAQMRRKAPAYREDSREASFHYTPRRVWTRRVC
jgi:hypothetical protein